MAKCCLGWAARDESGTLSPYDFTRRAVGEDDVSLRITHCGVCYADVLWSRNKLGNSMYPVVPGHEIVGVVTETGGNVKDFKAGDVVGVGTLVNSCRECKYCDEFAEIYCSRSIHTFNSLDADGSITKGGYSTYIVVHRRFCFRIPEGYPPEMAAPLLCAGITVYSPMVRHGMNLQPGKSLGVIGLGGLGHLAVMIGKAFGLEVSVFSTSASKREEALELLGADKFILSSDKKAMESSANTLDFIIDSASGEHPFDPYMELLKPRGVLVLVGFPGEVIRAKTISFLIGSRSICGSATGGTKDTQEMIDFCAANKVYPKIELIKIQDINEALERLIKGDIKFRFVIDIENSLK